MSYNTISGSQIFQISGGTKEHVLVIKNPQLLIVGLDNMIFSSSSSCSTWATGSVPMLFGFIGY